MALTGLANLELLYSYIYPLLIMNARLGPKGKERLRKQIADVKKLRE